MAERFTKSIMVQAAPATVYSLWANFENFPHFMENVKRVKNTAAETSAWEVAGPLGMTVTWEAETTRLDPNERIAWNTKDNRGLTTSGEVRYAGEPVRDVNHRVGYMTQKDTLLPWRTVEDNIGIAFELACRRIPKPEQRDRVREALRLVAPVDHQLARQLDRARVVRVQEEHGR